MIPTGPIGSIQRPPELLEAIEGQAAGRVSDAGFAPFGDDTSTSRETAFARIHARAADAALAAREL